MIQRTLMIQQPALIGPPTLIRQSALIQPQALHRSFALLLLLTCALVAPALAQPTASSRRPMRFEDLMKMRRLGDLSVSPDGRWVLFSATDVDLDANTRTSHLWLVSAAAATQAAGVSPREHILTASAAGEDRGRFSPDGKQLLFQSARSGTQQIYVANFDSAGGTIEAARPVTHISTEAGGAMWSPDSRQILFTSSVYPDCPAGPPQDTCDRERDALQKNSKVKAKIFTELLYRHWNSYTGEKRSHLFLVSVDGTGLRDLNPGDPHDVPPFSLGGPDAYAFSPDGDEVAFTENLDNVTAISTNADIFTLRLDDPRARPVKISTSPGGDFSPAYSPDGRYIAWRSQARVGYESDRFRLMLYDRGSKQIRELLPHFDRWVDELTWAPDSRTIYFVAGDRGAAHIFSLSQPFDGKDVVRISAQQTNMEARQLTREGEYSQLLPDPLGDHLFAEKMRANSPSEIVMLDTKMVRHTLIEGAYSEPAPELLALPQGLSEVGITHLNDDVLAELELPKIESFWFPSIDKVQVQGFLIHPPAFDANKKYPVKFLIHGGPQGAWGDAWSYRWNAELFAASGYVVVMINPRGSTGYGQAFTDGVNGDWGGKPFQDLMLGLTYAEQHYPFIDKTRECALGASYGGYMANWILGHSDRFKCIVSHDGMFNPESAYGTTEELWFNEWEFKGKPWDFYGQPPSQNPYRKWSPALSAKNFKTPTLVIHSQLDYRLDVSEGFQLFTTLQRMKVPSKMLYFPDEGHWILKPQNSRLWYETVNDWVDQYTKGDAKAADSKAAAK